MGSEFMQHSPEMPDRSVDIRPVGKISFDEMNKILGVAEELDVIYSPPMSNFESESSIEEVNETLGDGEIREHPDLIVTHQRYFDESGQVEESETEYNITLRYSPDARGTYSTSALASQDVEDMLQGKIKLEARIYREK